MLIKTLLNRCYWLKSFVYAKASMEMVKSEEAIVVQIEPRKNSRVCCSRLWPDGQRLRPHERGEAF